MNKVVYFILRCIPIVVTIFIVYMFYKYPLQSIIVLCIFLILCYIKRDAILGSLGSALDSVFEAGFRNQNPMDFMFCLNPVVDLLEGNGYVEAAVYNAGSEDPSVLMRNEETKSVIHIKLHAPLDGKYTYKAKDESLGHHLFEEVEFEDINFLVEFLKEHGMKECERTYEYNPDNDKLPFPESSVENPDSTDLL